MNTNSQQSMNNNAQHSMMEDMYIDNKDFLAKYLFNPAIDDEADFSHIDKNLAITRLASRYNEPERARNLLSALHVLNNNRYFREQRKEAVIDFEEIECVFAKCPTCSKEVLLETLDKEYNCCNQILTFNKVIVKKPVKELQIITQSLFPRSYHMLKSLFYSFTTTAMARDGHLIRQAGTTNFHQSQTMEDKTKVKGGMFNLSPTAKNQSRY